MIDEDKLERYFWDGMSDPMCKDFFKKMVEWKHHNGIAYRELLMMLKRAEIGEFTKKEE